MAGRKCPTCRKSIDESATERSYHPFCSARCRSADLSNWLNAAYRISAPVEEEDLDSGLPDGMAPGGQTPGDPDVN